MRIFCLHSWKNTSTSYSYGVNGKTEKDKKLDGAVQSAKERAKAWSDAAIATQTALEAMRKLVTDAATNPKANREFSSDG